MNINDENIGKLFQQKLNDLEVQPDQAVWASIEKQAGISSGLSTLAKVALYFTAATIVVTSYFVWQELKSTTQTNQIDTIAQTELNAPIINTLPEEVEPVTEEVVELNEIEISKQDAKTNKPQQTIINIPPSTDTVNIETPVSKVESKPISKPIQIKEQSPEDQIYQPQLISFEEDYSDTDVSSFDSDSIATSSHNSDTANIRFSQNPVICFGEDAVLEVIGGVNYEWSSGSNSPKVKVSPVEESTYWVIVFDQYGNEKKHYFTVYVDKECTSLFIPSAFSPNGDGVNDVFKAEGLGIQSFEMIIYNREGNIMFESRNIDISWDGTFRGEPVKPVGYLYQVIYVDAKGNAHAKKGTITLIR